MAKSLKFSCFIGNQGPKNGDDVRFKIGSRNKVVSRMRIDKYAK